MSQILTQTRTEFDTRVAEQLDDETGDYSGWYCVRTDPFPCPAAECDFVALYVTAAHLVVCWPRRDDRALLSLAHDAQRLGRQPVVVEYEPSFGPAISFDAWNHIGRPVHGRRERPDGVPYRAL